METGHASTASTSEQADHARSKTPHHVAGGSRSGPSHCSCAIRTNTTKSLGHRTRHTLTQQDNRLDAQRWSRAVEIFELALDADPHAREAIIAEQAAGDADLAETVRGMLQADSDTDSVLDTGIVSFAGLASESSPHALTAGDVLGDFEIISEIGRGGMGVVYAAKDRKLGRVAALKVLPPQFRIDPQASERLIAEAQAASALDHPNVATIYQVGDAPDGSHFIAMARYEGETLRERLSRGPLSPRDAFEIARQIAAGLAAAHAAGLIHRDVKPENIFITRQGLAKLLDFGIATLATAEHERGTTRGTVRYMSPEQARGDAVDARTDVWSLGVVLYEMITGASPVAGSTRTEIFANIRDAAPLPLTAATRNIPAAASSTLTKAIAKDRARRFANGAELHAALDRVIREWTRARTMYIAAAVAAGLMIIAWLGAQRINASAAPAPMTLAVLPVAGMSSDTAATNLASALRDEVASRIEAMRRGTIVALKDTAASPARRPRLLSFSLEQRGTLPVVRVGLTSSDGGSKLWNEERDLQRDDLREMARDFVIAIFNAIGSPLSPQERAAIGKDFPQNARAYQEYLLANRLLATRTQASVQAALDHYSRALQLDSSFASAYARQAYSYAVLMEWQWKPPPSYPADIVAEGLRLTDRATRLDSTSADAWLTRAYFLAQRDARHFTGALEAFQHAIALNPYDAEAFHQYAQTLTALGRYSEALDAYQRVLDIEPRRGMTLVPVAAIYKRTGRVRESLRFLDTAIVGAPNSSYVRATRSLVRTLLGDYDGALDDARKALKDDPDYPVPPLAALARAQWFSGDTADAIQTVIRAERSLVNPDKPSVTESVWLCMAEVGVGRMEKAKWIMRHTEPRGAWFWFYFQAPELDAFRRDPEVAAILRQADPRIQTD